MERHVERCADVQRGKRVVKRNAPRFSRRNAETASGGETAQTSDDMSQRDAGRKHIAGRPKRQIMPLDVPERHECRGDESSVKHPARSREHEHFSWIGAEIVEV